MYTSTSNHMKGIITMKCCFTPDFDPSQKKGFPGWFSDTVGDCITCFQLGYLLANFEDARTSKFVEKKKTYLACWFQF